jgi:hypothetical protein
MEMASPQRIDQPESLPAACTRPPSIAISIQPGVVTGMDNLASSHNLVLGVQNNPKLSLICHRLLVGYPWPLLGLLGGRFLRTSAQQQLAGARQQSWGGKRSAGRLPRP